MLHCAVCVSYKCSLRRCYRYSSSSYIYRCIYTFVCCNRFYVCFARFNLENCSPYKLSMLLPHCVVVLLLRMLLSLLLLAFLFLRLFRTCCAPSRCKSGNFGNVLAKHTHTLSCRHENITHNTYTHTLVHELLLF